LLHINVTHIPLYYHERITPASALQGVRDTFAQVFFVLCVFNRFDLTFSIQNLKNKIKGIVVDLPNERSVAATVSGR
jgi:hypothetical protein